MDRPTGVLSAGDPVLLTVHVPAKERPALRLYARALKGSRTPVPIRLGDRPGQYVGSFTPPVPGPYEFSVWVGKSEVDHFWEDVSSGWDEQIDMRPDSDPFGRSRPAFRRGVCVRGRILTVGFGRDGTDR
jgi:hypothetical protein